MSRRVQRKPDPREEAWLAGLSLLGSNGLFRSVYGVEFREVPRLVAARQ